MFLLYTNTDEMRSASKDIIENTKNEDLCNEQNGVLKMHGFLDRRNLLSQLKRGLRFKTAKFLPSRVCHYNATGIKNIHF